MTSAVMFDTMPLLAVAAEVPATRGVLLNYGAIAVEQQTLPTDPIGNFSLTLTNLVIGSLYEIEPLAGGAALAVGVALSAAVQVSISVYAGGSAANTLRVKVRKASESPFYQPYETQILAVNGVASLFINQLPDE